MERAAQLLTTTRLPVGQIGKMIGIDDPYYFSKAFKRYHRTTPTSFRSTRALIGSSLP